MLNVLLAAAVEKRGLSSSLKYLLREECGEEMRGRRKSSLGMILSSQNSCDNLMCTFSTSLLRSRGSVILRVILVPFASIPPVGKRKLNVQRNKTRNEDQLPNSNK